MSAGAQTVIVDTTYSVTRLECLSDYVDFTDMVRYFSGLVVKQGNRHFYLDAPYSLEVLQNRIVFDDADKYKDRVAVYLASTSYADMDEFKQAAIACFGSSAPDTTTSSISIDSLSYWGDTLRLYVSGNPTPFTAYIDGCPCAVPEPPGIPNAWFDPAGGVVWGDPSTGRIWAWFTEPQPEPAPVPIAWGDPMSGTVWGDPGSGNVWGWLSD